MTRLPVRPEPNLRLAHKDELFLSGIELDLCRSQDWHTGLSIRSKRPAVLARVDAALTLLTRYAVGSCDGRAVSAYTGTEGNAGVCATTAWDHQPWFQTSNLTGKTHKTRYHSWYQYTPSRCDRWPGSRSYRPDTHTCSS